MMWQVLALPWVSQFRKVHFCPSCYCRDLSSYLSDQSFVTILCRLTDDFVQESFSASLVIFQVKFISQVIIQCMYTGNTICGKLFIELHSRISDPFQQNPHLLHCPEVGILVCIYRGRSRAKKYVVDHTQWVGEGGSII